MNRTLEIELRPNDDANVMMIPVVALLIIVLNYNLMMIRAVMDVEVVRLAVAAMVLIVMMVAAVVMAVYDFVKSMMLLSMLAISLTLIYCFRYSINWCHFHFE